MSESPASIAIAGGTGFTGSRFVERMAQSSAIRVLARPTADLAKLHSDVDIITGDLGDSDALERWLEGMSTLVYCASMGFGHIPGLITAATDAGIRRAIFVSTTAVHTHLPADSLRVRLEAEKCVRGSGLVWTIIRPTMIYGAPGDRNIERLLKFISRGWWLPVPGDGEHLMQPVHVDDLVDGLVRVVLHESTVHKTYELSGAEPLSLKEILDASGRALGRSVRRVHLPLAMVTTALRTAEAIGVSLPLREEQVLRLAEDKAFSHRAATQDMGYKPRPFYEGVCEEARLLGLMGS